MCCPNALPLGEAISDPPAGAFELFPSCVATASNNATLHMHVRAAKKVYKPTKGIETASIFITRSVLATSLLIILTTDFGLTYV